MQALRNPEVTATPFRAASRINRSLTAPLEKRTLEAMARHAPRWLSSDQLTALGFLGQLAAGACYALAYRHRGALLAASVCIALNWVGDSLDGTLARVRGQGRPRYGFYVDHMVDLFGATAMMAGLGLSGLVHWPVAAVMLIAFLLLAGESYLATYTLGCFHLSTGPFGPTEVRLLLIAGNVALLRSPFATVAGHRLLLLDVGGVIASVCMVVLVVALALQHGAQLYRAEPLP